MDGLIGKKLGMTQVFNDQGVHVPVTVIQAGPCVVVQRKTRDNDGYESAQIGFEERKEKRLTKAQQGHFKKAGVTGKRILQEVKLDAGEDVKVGQTVTVEMFTGVSHVDVIGMTKGRGFQGVVKRHQFMGGAAAHGSMMHRRSGAIGNRTWPARIFKNKRMPGHMGHVQVTTQNLVLVGIKGEDNVLLIEGAVPGPVGGIVMVRKSIKKPSKAAKKS